ncbi:integral membrane protein GPR137 isoform X1 [Chrysemys picta bellii]|uniref:integral membrane protein GPR137 isoform X1 n=1 Tax=Chrysemys picta bellii TaxID=8478 RepID=UPI0032B21B98
MPLLGMGTFRLQGAELVSQCVEAALAHGYRSFDTAAVYGNEAAIGQALRALLPLHGLARSDVFLTTKLGPRDQGKAEAEAACLRSLEQLACGYLDLYLIHWPGTQGKPQGDKGNRERRWESWRALEQMHHAGHLRAIGVSNYTLGHLQELLAHCRVPPAVLQVVFKAKAKYHPNMTKGLLAVRGACLGASLLFLAVNVACAFVVRLGRAEPWAVVLTRVLINDSLFVLGAITLALCLCLVARGSPSTSLYLQAKGTTVCQTAAMGGTMVLLHASRACYNLVALALSSHTRLDSFDYDWYNVSDQADLITDLGDQGYLVFGLILFVWELLPTALLVGFFRVHRPPQDLSANHIINGQLGGSRSYFFDHPGQYENEGPSRRKGSSLAGRLGSGSWYGAIGRTGRDPDWLGGQPPTTPLLFSQVTVQASHHHSLYSTPQT